MRILGEVADLDILGDLCRPCPAHLAGERAYISDSKHAVNKYHEAILRFSVYFDTPTSFLLTPAATQGHMSNEAGDVARAQTHALKITEDHCVQAFLQFCIDFQLFPQIIDFNSLRRGVDPLLMREDLPK